MTRADGKPQYEVRTCECCGADCEWPISEEYRKKTAYRIRCSDCRMRCPSGTRCLKAVSA